MRADLGAHVDLKVLRAFVVLAEELHFTRAAERLGVAQPVMSQWIRRLEQELGAVLVERTTRAARLTASGQAALPFARQTVEAARLMERAADLDGAPVVGAVTLGYAGASSRPWLPPIARAVRQQAPGVELHLRSMVYAGAGPSRRESGEVDRAFRRRPISRPGLVERIFEYERILVGLPSDHPLADQESVGMEQLRHEPWVMFPGTRGSSVREMGLRLATEAGYQPRIAQEAPDSYTVLGLVAAGVGVTLTVSSVSHVATPGLRLVPLDGPARYLTATLVHRQNPSPATQAVLDVIAQVQPVPDRPEGLHLD